jgi:hypothetical protein
LDLPGGTSLGTAFLEQGSLLDSGRVEESHSVRSIPLCAGYKTCTVFFFFPEHICCGVQMSSLGTNLCAAIPAFDPTYVH